MRYNRKCYICPYSHGGEYPCEDCWYCEILGYFPLGNEELESVDGCCLHYKELEKLKSLFDEEDCKKFNEYIDKLRTKYGKGKENNG